VERRGATLSENFIKEGGTPAVGKPKPDKERGRLSSRTSQRIKKKLKTKQEQKQTSKGEDSLSAKKFLLRKKKKRKIQGEEI